MRTGDSCAAVSGHDCSFSQSPKKDGGEGEQKAMSRESENLARDAHSSPRSAGARKNFFAKKKDEACERMQY